MVQKKLYILVLVLLSLSFQLLAISNDGSRYASNSVLSNGTWSKIKISETGIYKLTYKDLKKMGITNPQNVQIYGYGGWMLDEDFSKPYTDDLPQISVWRSTSRENFTHDDDYILFYGRGDIMWSYDSVRKEFYQTQNPYSTDSYYFVTESEDGPRIATTQASLSLGSNVTNVYNDYTLHEKELESPQGGTGRDFWGENLLKKSTVDITFDTKGATTDAAIVTYAYVTKAFPSSALLTVKVNNTESSAYSEVDNDYYTIAVKRVQAFSVPDLNDNTTVKVSYTKGSSTDKNAYLDYVRLNFKRNLKPYSAVTPFRSTTIADNLGFRIADASSSLLVFDVTDNTSIQKVNTQLSGTQMTFAASNTNIREYVMVDLSKLKDIPTPEIVEQIENQNLHATSNDFDMVIIVNDYLREYADELARLHEVESGFRSLVVSPQSIYNEFSSGKPDMTAFRRFLKMFYDRAATGNDRPQYALIFGGGTFDNKLIQKWSDEAKKSMILTYQSKAQEFGNGYIYSETEEYTTDDYIALLGDNTGTSLVRELLDMSVGRLPVRSKQEAAAVIGKISAYMSPNNVGIWANNVTIVADDLNSGATMNVDKQHIRDAETMANTIAEKYPDFIVNKIYEDMYERVVNGNGASYPLATRALLDNITQGTLIMNFIGHGATTYLTHENLLTKADIEGLNNTYLPLWITATCDFSRFDANASSGGEIALLKDVGGAIALFSTSRPVRISQNTKMNESLTKYLFETENGERLRLGDIIRKAKNNLILTGADNELRFALLGDPALKLAYPDGKYKVEVLEMNGRDADATDINIEALGNISVKGAVVRSDGSIVTDYNGTLESVIFDVEQSLKTRGNMKSGATNDAYATSYEDYTNTLFSGKVVIKDGVFKIDFVAPKDILYKEGTGKMSFYAYDTDRKREAQGSFYNYTVGGTNTNQPEEENPPVISKMYLNNEQFRSGDYVSSTPIFYAEVSDDTGINLSSGIGHNLSLVLDGITVYDLTPYFENEDNSSKKGRVKYQLPQLTEGAHTLEFNVWDVWNNSASSTIDFIVTDNFTPSIHSFEIWGNPAKDYTRFVFNTSTPSSNIDLTIRVYSLTGALVWMTQQNGAVNTLNQYIYEWDLRGYGQGRLLPGVYICTAQMSINGKKSSTKSQKLIITR